MKAVEVLERRKLGVWHRGLLLDDGRVLHNTPEKGEHISSFSEYAKGERVIRKPIPNYLRTASASRILNIILNPSPYSWATRNCQHTANEVIYGESKSEYVALGFALVAVGLSLYLMRSR